VLAEHAQFMPGQISTR